MSVEELTNSLESRVTSDGGVDYIQMIEQSSIVGRIASITLGLLASIIVIMIPIIITVEIIYICFPFIREKMNDMIIKVESKGHSHTLLGFTLKDARRAVEEANITYVGERSALWIYLKIKCKSVMFIMLILALVLEGSSGIITWVWNLFSGILQYIM